jgi:HEAT repeat protein
MRRRSRRLDRLLASLREADPEARRLALEEISRRQSSWRRGAEPSARQLHQAFGRISTLLRHDPDPTVRYEAAYLLTHWFEGRAAVALLEVLDDATSPAKLRGQAAEGVGMVLDPAFTRPRALRARAVAALRRGLADDAPDVRFWCVYALGSVKATDARAEIERLAATDTAPCPYMWRVRDEAADVLTFWAEGVWPRRTAGERGPPA